MDYRGVLLALLMAVATSVVAQGPINPCQDGKYLNSVGEYGECLDQCPCGYYGNASRFCVQGNNLFFNQTSFNFKLSVNDIFDTPIFSAILYIDKNLMTSESSFQVFLYGPFFDSGRIFFFNPFLLFNNLGRIRLKIENVDSNTTGYLYQSQTFNNTNSSECVAGSRTLAMVRVEVYAVSVTGSFGFSIHATKLRSPVYYSSSATASGTVDTGCSSGLSYDFISRQCVASCPCGTHKVHGSCKTIPTMAFDPIPQSVQVDPTSKSGSTVATVKLWIDEAVLNSSTSLGIFKYTGLIHHNFSDRIVPHFSSRVRPLFGMSPSDDSSISSTFYLNFDSDTLPHLKSSLMERCAVATSAKRYVAISFDLKLLSDSLYHLGDHNIYMDAYLLSGNNSYAFETILQLTVEAECPDSSQLYDFELHRCVSSCSCGYSPLRSHTTAYCEAVEYHASEFHDETYTVPAPCTRADSSASIPLYVNLDSYFFNYMSPYGGGIVARLEIQSTFRQPEVSFVQPDGSLSSTLEIALNSSLEFTYCHDKLLNINHTVYNVPIIVSSSSEDNGHVNYRYNIDLTHYSPNDYFLTQILQYDRNDSLTLFVNRTGISVNRTGISVKPTDINVNPTVYIQPVVPGSSLAIAVGVPVGVVGGVAIIILIFMVVVVAVVGLRFYRERKAMEFRQFYNEENAYENVSMEETDSSSKANEKHNDDTSVTMENVNEN